VKGTGILFTIAVQKRTQHVGCTITGMKDENRSRKPEPPAGKRERTEGDSPPRREFPKDAENRRDKEPPRQPVPSESSDTPSSEQSEAV